MSKASPPLLVYNFYSKIYGIYTLTILYYYITIMYNIVYILILLKWHTSVN